ncbi:MAG TPA: GNAT family N-acetyltransferase [Ruminiclostridium sp.]
MNRELYDLLMERPISKPIHNIELQDGYSIVAISEENGYIWEQIMSKAFDEHKAGTFRYIMVSNNYYDDERVFVLLDDNKEPIATATSWQNDNWWNDKEHGSIIFVGVAKSHRGQKLGCLMANYVLQDIAKRGFTIATLNVEENNLPAIKTYINCGFTPQIPITEHIEIWNEQYNKLSLTIPEYDSLLRPLNDSPHPPQPWPYQLRCANEAISKGNIYVFGKWEKHNMYLVDSTEYYKLKCFFMLNNELMSHYDFVCKNNIGQIFVDKPYNPSVALLENSDGLFCLVGDSKDRRFIDGIHEYLEKDCNAKYNQSKKHIELIEFKETEHNLKTK